LVAGALVEAGAVLVSELGLHALVRFISNTPIAKAIIIRFMT
jgi:hypothetical protein